MPCPPCELARSNVLKRYRVVDRFSVGKHDYRLLEKEKAP